MKMKVKFALGVLMKKLSDQRGLFLAGCLLMLVFMVAAATLDAEKLIF